MAFMRSHWLSVFVDSFERNLQALLTDKLLVCKTVLDVILVFVIGAVKLRAAHSRKNFSVDASELLFFLLRDEGCKLVINFVSTLALVAE
jgi:hypothetical protein